MIPFPTAIVAIVLGIIIAILAREYWLFRQLPAVSGAVHARGDRTRARQILEKLLAKPALLGARSHANIHHRLAWIYLEERRPQEAAEQARKSLAARLLPAIEALHRMRLADCLEACGDMEAAATEREFAKRLAESGPENVAQFIACGKSLRREGRYAEAIPVYERAIELAGEMAPGVRTHLLVTLALSCWEAGHIHQALSWADQALGISPDYTHRTTAYSVSALALGNLGRLDEAEERWNLAFTAATTAGNTAQAARYLATLAEVQRRRGKIVEAVETCERAAGMSLESRRIARFAEFECFVTWGRFSDAREMLEQGARAPGFAKPASERRIQALTALNRALLSAEEGHPQEALPHLDEAKERLERDEKVGITYHAMRAWIEAVLGRRTESENSARSATDFAARMPDDRAVLLRYHTYLGRAALEAGEVDTGRYHFQSCINLVPDPAELPRARYFLGECCRICGDLTGARTEWQAALDTDLDTRYVSLARRRLKEFHQTSSQNGASDQDR